jgi:hypothetical protein
LVVFSSLFRLSNEIFGTAFDPGAKSSGPLADIYSLYLHPNGTYYQWGQSSDLDPGAVQQGDIEAFISSARCSGGGSAAAGCHCEC